MTFRACTCYQVKYMQARNVIFLNISFVFGTTYRHCCLILMAPHATNIFLFKHKESSTTIVCKSWNPKNTPCDIRPTFAMSVMYLPSCVHLGVCNVHLVMYGSVWLDWVKQFNEIEHVSFILIRILTQAGIGKKLPLQA